MAATAAQTKQSAADKAEWAKAEKRQAEINARKRRTCAAILRAAIRDLKRKPGWEPGFTACARHLKPGRFHLPVNY